jgi:hypothetical protein
MEDALISRHTMPLVTGSSVSIASSDDDLRSSRVYRMARSDAGGFSLLDSTIQTQRWSAFSKLSLADISAISVVALPLFLADIPGLDKFYRFGEIASPYELDGECVLPAAKRLRLPILVNCMAVPSIHEDLRRSSEGNAPSTTPRTTTPTSSYDLSTQEDNTGVMRHSWISGLASEMSRGSVTVTRRDASTGSLHICMNCAQTISRDTSYGISRFHTY